MADLEDCTEIFKMKQDFQGFAARSAKSAKRSNPLSIVSTLGPQPGQLNFDEFSMLHSGDLYSSSASSSKFGKSSVTIGSLIEKDQECKKKEAKLIQAKATIAELQSQISSLETSRKRQRIELEHDLENFKQENTHTNDRIEELKQQLHVALLREEETESKLSACREQLTTNKATFNTKVSTLQRAKIELEAQLDEIQQKSRAQIMELKSENMRQQTEMDICRSQMLESQEQLAASMKRCSDLKMQIQELEEYRLKSLNSDFKVKDLETTLSRMEGDAVVTKAMKAQLDRLAELERENRKLREENTYCKNTQENVHLLREKLESATQRLTRTEARVTEADKLEAQCEDLQQRLDKWESCSITGANRPTSPAQVSRQMLDLQQSNLLTLEKQGQLQTMARSLEQAQRKTKAELHATKIRLDQEQQKTTQNSEYIKQVKRKLLLFKKERDGYKQILDSYEHDVTMNARGSPEPARVRHLEETLQGYRNQMAQLEAQLEHSTSQRYAAEARVLQLQSEFERRVSQQQPAATSEVDQKIIAELRRQVAEVQSEVERVTEERDVLAGRIEQRHLQGDYDPTKTNVIHLRVNPSSVAQERRAAEVHRLKEEKNTLHERLRLLEETGGEVEDLTVRVQEKLAQPSSSHEVEEIRASLNSAELKNKRLMEAFKKKSQEFREVCFQLLGYRIDIPTDSQYRLMNIYAETPDEYLMFQQGEGGVMELLSTEYSACLSDKIETYLQHADSIPAFLSSITLQLFNRQTMYQHSMDTS